MYKIVFIVPSQEYAELIHMTFEEHERTELEEGIATGIKYCCEVKCFERTVDILDTNFKADALVARSLGAQELKKSGVDIPVIEIPITGNDILKALGKISGIHRGKTVAAIGTKIMLNDVSIIGEIIGLKVKPYYINSHNKLEFHRLVEQAYEEGCKAIIGGYTSYKYGCSKGINAIMIETGREAIWQAINEAKRAINIMIKEQEKRLRMKAIFDYSYEGIITTDYNNIITVINNKAEQILGIKSSEVIGKKIDNIIVESNFSNAVIGNKMYINELFKYKNIQLSVNKVPLSYRDNVIGNVITFQDVTKIQEIENKLRNKIYCLGHVAKFSFKDIIGSSEKTKETINLAKRFAKVNSNILIVGETGTGKEVFAQSIHNYSNRKNGPFVAVNCAALPESILESEFFGYVDGAFTGAAKGGKPGLFELAHNGTIFLDEISELPPKLQGRLLRVIQERKIMRLGHDRVISVDVRIIVATNKDLRSLVKEGEFREDLYFRLDVLKLKLPPLRKRRDDIRAIAENYFKKFASELGRGEVLIEDKAINIMENYNWQGNIRELGNFCERLVVTAEGEYISSKDVENIFIDKFEADKNPDNCRDEEVVTHNLEKYQTCYLREGILNMEKDKISEVLRICNNNKVKVAKHLGISRTTLWRRMKECGLDL